MKTSIIKHFVLIVLALATSTVLKAQTENSSERLITQLKNGTAPGLLFSIERPAPAPALNEKINEKESLVAQIRKGKAAGMQFKPVAAGTAPAMARAATVVPKQPLLSDQPAAKVEQAKPAVAPVPTQD